MDKRAINYDSLHRYRNRLKSFHPSQKVESLSDDEFMKYFNLAAIDGNGNLYPTKEGLLMFGNEKYIIKEFPNYHLEFQDNIEDTIRWCDILVSTSGDWSGNIYDFYFRVYNKFSQYIKVPFKLDGGNRIDDTPVHKALREVLANCLIHADYYGKNGIVIIKEQNNITFSNPGDFRIDIDEAKIGGISDPRNATLMKMFNLIGIGEKAGSGIPNIYATWEKQGWIAPVILETFNPERVSFSLTLDLKQMSAINVGDKPQSAINHNINTIIIEYLKEHETATCALIAKRINLKVSRTRDYLSSLVANGVIEAIGSNKNRTYKLKNN